MTKNIHFVQSMEEFRQCELEHRFHKEDIVYFKCSKCGGEAHRCYARLKKEKTFLCTVCKKKQTNLKKFGCENPFQSKEVQEKIRQTNLKRHGCEYPSQNSEIYEKQRQTNLKRYGCKNPSQSKEIRDRVKKTNLKRYGCENPNQNKEVRERIKKTNLKRYGCEVPMQNEEVKEKTRQTNLKRYGCEYPAQNPNVREKQKQTNLTRFGCEHQMNNENVKARARQTNLKKYGCENPMQNEEIKCKAKQTNLKRYGCKNPMQNEEVKNKATKTRLETERSSRNTEEHQKHVKEEIESYGFSILGFDMIDGEFVYTLKCKECGNVFKYCKYVNSQYYTQYPYCKTCYCEKLTCGMSKQEKELCTYIRTLTDKEVIENDRSVLGSKELDIYIPELNLAFEYDGLYFHNNVDNSFKFFECQKRGIRLVQITEYEWLCKTEKIKAYLRNLFHYNQTVLYARKCTINELGTKEYKNFVEENHLQGYRHAHFKYGLFFNGELVEVIGLNKIDDGFELVRECSKNDIIVVGGKTRLLKNFLKIYQGTILSYCEVAKFSGKSYLDNMFVLDHISKPNYKYYKNLNEYTRQQCQKHKLQKFLGDKFDSKKSETENMLAAGYTKMFDYGNYVFKLVV